MNACTGKVRSNLDGEKVTVASALPYDVKSCVTMRNFNVARQFCTHRKPQKGSSFIPVYGGGRKLHDSNSTYISV